MDATTIESVMLEGHNHGLRIDDVRYGIGDELPNSREWDDDELTGDMIDGTCTIGLGDVSRALALAAKYTGRYVYVVATRHPWTPGEDRGEWILRDPVVLAVWERA